MRAACAAGILGEYPRAKVGTGARPKPVINSRRHCLVSKQQARQAGEEAQGERFTPSRLTQGLGMLASPFNTDIRNQRSKQSESPKEYSSSRAVPTQQQPTSACRAVLPAQIDPNSDGCSEVGLMPNAES